jgi:cytosine/adenosine deaminase-related metal-dependent hydrolase
MRIKNAWICQIKNSLINPLFGELLISDGKIKEIIPADSKLSQETKISKEDIDAGGRVVTAPNINFHDHFYSRLAKGLTIKGETNNFQNILKNLWWKLDMILDNEMIKASAQLAVLESVRNGVTYVFDHHSSPNVVNGSLEFIADTIHQIGVRGVLCFETTDRNGKLLADEGLKENQNFLNNLTNENIKGMLGLHASFTLEDDSLQSAAAFLREQNIGIHIHLCEDKVDREISLKEFNNLPVERLQQFKLLNDRSILAHGIHLTESEFRIIKKSGSAFAYNPDSNLNNVVGLPDFSHVPKDIPLLSGTDGMNSNPARSLKQIFLLSRCKGMSFDEAFSLVIKIYFDQINFVGKYFRDFPTLNGNDRADFVVWDYIPPTPFTSENFWGHYIYGVLERPVHSVVQDGRVLMNEFRFSFDESEMNKNIVEQGNRLYNKFNTL